MDCSSMYQCRQRFSEIGAVVFQYRPNFEEVDQFYVTRKLDAVFLVRVLHVNHVSKFTNITNSSIYPKACTLLSVPC